MKNTEMMPPGIRRHTLKDGAVSYEARVNRQGTKLSERFSSIREAVSWKNRTDVLIESGYDPQQFKVKKPATSSERALPNRGGQQPMLSLIDKPTAPKTEMTVEQAINGYLAHRATSHIPLKANQITEFERFRDDLGMLVVANMTNRDLATYISYLLTTVRKRDDPAHQKPPESALGSNLNMSAKACANRKYKEKLKAQKPVRAPKTLAPATVRKYVMSAQTALNWQAKNNGVEVNKFLFEFDAKVMPAGWSGRRDRRLEKGEEERLYAAGIERGEYTYNKADWQAIIGFDLETGLRQQEIALAKWTHIKSDGYKLFIPKENSKTLKDRTALLSKRAREIIEIQRASSPKGGKRIFHQFPNARAICDAYALLTERAGIENLTFHDLRHEATSRLCESGKMSQMEIMEMTGHDTMVTFRGYVKLLAHENARRLD
jgi:integrase